MDWKAGAPSGWQPPKRRNMTIKDAIRLYRGELMIVPILLALLGTTMLLSRERMKTEDAMATMQKELDAMADKTNATVQSQERTWNEGKDELLKSLPAAERVKVDAFVTENVLRAHAIPLDDSKLLANKVRERQDQLRAEREKKAGGDVKEEKKAETPVAAPAPANKEKAPVKFF